VQKRLERRKKTMRALRRSGVPVADIACKYSLSESYVRQITAGAVPKDGRNLLRRSPEFYRQVVEARTEGFSLKDIAAHFDLPLSTVGIVIRRHQAAAKGPTQQSIDEILKQLSKDLRGI